MKLKDKINQILILLKTELLRFHVRRGKPGEKNKILVVRLDGIGDFFLWLDHARIIRKYYADAEVTLLCSKLWRDAAEKLLDYDRVIPFEGYRFLTNWKYRRDLLQYLKEYAYDIVIQPRCSRDFILEDQITRFCSAPENIAFRSSKRSFNPPLMKVSDKWYNQLYSLPDEVTGEKAINEFFTGKLTEQTGHEVKQQLHQEKTIPPLVEIPGEWTKRPYFIIIPGAADPGRRWPPEKFADAVNQLQQNHQVRCIICGSESDKTAAKIIIEENKSDKLLDLTGKTTILQLVELIRKSEFVLSNDTGAVHIASYFGIKSVCILGGGHWGRFLPYDDDTSSPSCAFHQLNCYRCDWKCIYPRASNKPYFCVQSVNVSDVLEAAEKLNII